MTFEEVLDQAIALLRQRGRLTYRTLQLQFQLDEAHLEALKDELIEGQRLALDEAGRVLVWTGGAETLPTAPPSSPPPAPQPAFQEAARPQTVPPPAAPSTPDAPGAGAGVQLAVRLGVHTGLVVVGDVGGGARQEQLALGETPNLAARLQGLAAPNTLVISAATFHLFGGFFACQPLGTPLVKGFAQPLEVYQVLSESTARSRLDAAGSTGLTPLVGREQEVRLLLERWTQVKDGLGQVVLLTGEAGIGKSRLVEVLKAHVATEPQAWLTPCQCVPYYKNTALYPMIDLLERVALRFEREETPPQKLSKLEGFLVQYGLTLAEAVPLFATLLSLPLTADYAPLPRPPGQQQQVTLPALVTLMLRI